MSAKTIPDKFEREWLDTKPTAIINYSEIANTLAGKIVASKSKMIQNFLTAISLGKYEKGLNDYIGNDLMGNAFRDGMNAKTKMTDSEKTKIYKGVIRLRELTQLMEHVASNPQDYIFFYKAVPKYQGLLQRRNMEISLGVGNTLKLTGIHDASVFNVVFTWANYMAKNLDWQYLEPGESAGASGSSNPNTNNNNNIIPKDITREDMNKRL